MLRTSILALCASAACTFNPGAAGQGAGSDGGTGGPDGRRAIDAPVILDAPAPMISFVQAASQMATPWNNGGGSVIATFPAAVSAGDLIAIYVSFEGTGSLSSVHDTASNTYAILQTVNDGGNTQKSAIAYAKNVAGGTITVTAAFGGGPCCRLIIAHELHGASPTAPLDGFSGQDQGSTGTATDAVTTGPVTTTMPGDYVFAASSDASNAGGQNILGGTGEQLRVMLTGNSGNPAGSEDRLVATPGAVSSTFTYAKDGAGLTQQMAFKHD